MWNPWKATCPACKAVLEMSWFSKITTVLSGVAWAGVAIYMEETKRWAVQDSLFYFAITLPIIFAIGYILWPKIKLYAKHKNA